MYSDDDIIMISALQHYLFCKRQCALIHIEQVWSENGLTASGRALHSHVDSQKSETRGPLRQVTSLRLFSRHLGITGVADMVEFHQTDSETNAKGQKIAIPLKKLSKYWIPFPVEYKHGKPKEHYADEVQLCAQAICLEGMLHLTIVSGVLFYGKTRRRMDVSFDGSLRCRTENVARETHMLIANGITPSPEYSKKCDACSLEDYCSPRIATLSKSARKWLDSQVTASLHCPPETQ